MILVAPALLSRSALRDSSLQVDWQKMPTGIPRCGGARSRNTHTAFGVKFVIDELAHIDASTGRHFPILVLAAGA
jgi:hypothetical protein